MNVTEAAAAAIRNATKQVRSFTLVIGKIEAFADIIRDRLEAVDRTTKRDVIRTRSGGPKWTTRPSGSFPASDPDRVTVARHATFVCTVIQRATASSVNRTVRLPRWRRAAS